MEDPLIQGYNSSIKLVSYMKESHNEFIYDNKKVESYYVNKFYDIIADNDDILHDIVDKSAIIKMATIKKSKERE